MGQVITNKFIRTSEVMVRAEFELRRSPEGSAKFLLFHHKESTNSLGYFYVSDITKDEYEIKLFVVLQALAKNDWLILDRGFEYEHFEHQRLPGYIGELKLTPPEPEWHW